MKKIRLLSVFIAVILLFIGCFVPAFAADATTLEDPDTGITAEGVFPDNTTLTADIEDIADNPLCRRVVTVTFIVTSDYGDADTYGGDSGITISIPYRESGLKVIGFDSNGDPVDTKAEYSSGKYVFFTDDIGDGVYWLSEQTISSDESNYKYQQFKDNATGVTVKGYFPKNSHLLVRDVSERESEGLSNQYGALYYDIKVYNNFKEVSPNGTVRVSIPHKEDDRIPLMQMTMDEIRGLTDEQDDSEINYFDRRWIDVQAKYKKGAYTFDASRVGTFCIATQKYYADIGGGTMRGTPPIEEGLKPFSSPINTIIWSAVALALVTAAAVSVIMIRRRRNK